MISNAGSLKDEELTPSHRRYMKFTKHLWCHARSQPQGCMKWIQREQGPWLLNGKYIMVVHLEAKMTTVLNQRLTISGIAISKSEQVKTPQNGKCQNAFEDRHGVMALGYIENGARRKKRLASKPWERHVVIPYVFSLNHPPWEK
jgi:hypothetical protein